MKLRPPTSDRENPAQTGPSPHPSPKKLLLRARPKILLRQRAFPNSVFFTEQQQEIQRNKKFPQRKIEMPFDFSFRIREYSLAKCVAICFVFLNYQKA
jgi:hypothetical protein